MDTRYLLIPSDLLGRKNESARISTAALPKLEIAPPHTIESRLPYEMPWDLLTLLAQAVEGDIPLTLQDSRITKRVARRINEAFLQPDDLKSGTSYIDIVIHLGQTLGLLEEKDKGGEQPTLAITPKADEWAKLSFNAQRRRLFGVWQEDRKWAEPATYGTIYWWNSDLTGGRKGLVNQLLESAGRRVGQPGCVPQAHTPDRPLYHLEPGGACSPVRAEGAPGLPRTVVQYRRPNNRRHAQDHAPVAGRRRDRAG